MKGKKLLSMLTAGALAVTMAMPVMAADTGTVDVDVATKSAVLRVTVPTSLAVAVDQFEMTNTGTQIYSAPFTMENNSAIAVKVDVTSTADIKAGTKLLASKAAAEASTAEGEAWLAVAAQTSDGKYIETTGKDVGDLTEESLNVKTFAQGTDADADKGTAAQTFYLKKASAEKYKLLNAGESAANISYAQFYELTPQTVADANALTALLKDNDIYVATAVAADGQALTFVAKGGTHSYNASDVCYTAAITPTSKASIDPSKLYVYADGTVDATDGKAAFRYIGNLSGAQEEWSDTDITNVHINYAIVGVRDTKYDEVKDDCVYGLYAPTPDEVTGTQITNGGGNTIFDTPAKLATQMKAYSVVFRFDTSATDVSGLSVTKIVVDGTTYEFTKGTAANGANSDGSAYTLKNFTANTATMVEVYYGDSYKISYDLTPASP